MSEEWKPVTSEDELAPGMTLERRPCSFCGENERIMLVNQVGHYSGTVNGATGPRSATGMTWAIAFPTCTGSRWQMFTGGIAKGTLWRLAEKVKP